MERWVQFWRMFNTNYEPLPGPVPGQAIHDALDYASRNGHRLYHRSSLSYDVLLEPIGVHPWPHLAAYRIRREGLPAQELGGTVTDLNISGNLAEDSHFIFLERNVFALVYNHFGPRANRFISCLNDMFRDLDIRIMPVYRPDLIEALEDLDRITRLEVALPADQVHLLIQDGDDRDVAQALETMSTALHDGWVRVDYSTHGRRRAGLQERIRNLARAVAGGDNLMVVKRAKAWGANEGEAVRPLDLQNDHLVTKGQFEAVSGRSRRVANSSAMNVVSSAYSTYQDHIYTSVASLNSAHPINIGPFVPEDQRQ